MDLERRFALRPYLTRVFAKGNLCYLQKLNSETLEGHVFTDLVKLAVSLSSIILMSSKERSSTAHFDQVW